MSTLLQDIKEARYYDAYEVYDAEYKHYGHLTVLYDYENDKWIFNIVKDGFEANYLIYTEQLETNLTNDDRLESLIAEIWYYNNEPIFD